MSEPGTPTLDQLRVFLTVVETGSFAAAARRLGRATSVISYAIANLESQLGLVLFERDATRRPVLTVAGRAVLGEARAVAHGIDGLRAKARGLLGGLEAEVNLAVDVLLPTARVVDALKAFQQEFPTVALRLHVETLGAVAQLLLDRTAVLGVGGPLAADIAGLERIDLGSVELIPVARPNHPLAGEAGAMPGAAREHVQLVLTDRSTLTQGRDFAVASSRTWRLADLGAKHALLLAGLGWGNMPAPMVAEDLRAGRLVRLALAAGAAARYPFYAIYRTETPPGPATAWLLQRLRDQSTAAP